MRRIAITGATGHVGRPVVAVLRERGDEVVALARPGRNVDGAQHTLELAPTTDPAALGRALAAHGVDAVVHLAAHYVRRHAPSDVATLVSTNVGLGAVLLDAMRVAGIGRLVLADSAFAHQGTDGTSAAGLYAATRQALGSIADWYAETHGVDVVRLVIHDVYGPDDDRPRLVPTLLRARASGAEVTVVGEPVRLDLVHVDDVVRAVVVALDGAPAGMWAVRTGAERTPAEVATLLAEVGGQPLRHRLVVAPDDAPTPWRGPLLPGWTPRISLGDGLAALCRA